MQNQLSISREVAGDTSHLRGQSALLSRPAEDLATAASAADSLLMRNLSAVFRLVIHRIEFPD
jgi:hypothetical protein